MEPSYGPFEIEKDVYYFGTRWKLLGRCQRCSKRDHGTDYFNEKFLCQDCARNTELTPLECEFCHKLVAFSTKELYHLICIECAAAKEHMKVVERDIEENIYDFYVEAAECIKDDEEREEKTKKNKREKKN